MSFAAIAWAMRQETGSTAAKMALLVLADHATDTGQAWPCLITIAKASSVDPRTVRTALARLERLGLVTDTGKRRGASGRVKVWQLEIAANPISAVLPPIRKILHPEPIRI